MTSADRIPVIVATGEICDRRESLENALEPIALMAAALHRAEDATGQSILRDIDSLDVVNLVSWPYAAPADALCARLGIDPARRVYGAVGGETPLRFLHEAAARIARGESSVAAVCGGEAHLSAARAASRGVALPWTPRPEHAAESIRGQDIAHPLAKALGVHLPVTVYPFYENAGAQAKGLTPQTALEANAALWSRMSQVASANPFAWHQRGFSAAEIIATDDGNRMIAEPYRKLMVANIAVNQGGAIILTSLAVARRLGLDDGRLVFVHGGYSAKEPTEYLKRNGYDRCSARDLVLDRIACSIDRPFDHVELYSCFPCVPTAARDTLGLLGDDACTVTGGLTFFGAPLNNYMTHAMAAMTRALGERPGTGLLYGQGGFMTKHHAVVIGSEPDTRLSVTAPPSLSAQVAAEYGPVPQFAAEASGAATVESHTIVYDRDGSGHGVVIARLEGGATRTLARVDRDEIAELRRPVRFAVGRAGHVTTRPGGIPIWRFAA